MENRMTHSYIADDVKLQGFRDGIITQAWIPIDFSEMHGPVSWWKDKVIAKIDRNKVDIPRYWRVETLVEGRTYEAFMSGPYAVGDALEVVGNDVGPPAVECRTCGKPKSPAGRSVGMEAVSGYCNFECNGYTEDPRPSSLFPGEKRSDFGYPSFGVTITSVEAKTLGEMVYGDLRSAGCPVADFNADPWRVDPVENEHRVWWNARYPEHPWDPGSKREQWCWKVGLDGPRAKLLLQKVKEGETS